MPKYRAIYKFVILPLNVYRLLAYSSRFLLCGRRKGCGASGWMEANFERCRWWDEMEKVKSRISECMRETLRIPASAPKVIYIKLDFLFLTSRREFSIILNPISPPPVILSFGMEFVLPLVLRQCVCAKKMPLKFRCRSWGGKVNVKVWEDDM